MFVVAYRIMLVCERVLVGREDCEMSTSLRASSPIWASATSLARTRERAAKPRP